MYTQTILISILAGLAAASPVEVRQVLGGTGATSSEFSSGGCKDILFAWARGSTEIGNMVRIAALLHGSPSKSFALGNCRRSSHLRRSQEELWSRRRRH
jgi:hypothetical protein